LIRLSRQQFNQRAAQMTARFDRLGETELQDNGEKRKARRLTWIIRSPSSEWLLAEFRYSEWYRRSGADWHMTKYHYDFFDRSHGGRRAYHCHDLPPARAVPHAHCEVPIGYKTADHFRYFELDLIEAHEEFERTYAADDGVSCAGLLELRRGDL
jgi:hypothetical protein